MHTKGHRSLINKKPTQGYGKEHYRSSQRFKIQEIPDLGMFYTLIYSPSASLDCSLKVFTYMMITFSSEPPIY